MMGKLLVRSPNESYQTLVMVQAALLLGIQHYVSTARDQNWSARCHYNVSEWNMS